MSVGRPDGWIIFVVLISTWQIYKNKDLIRLHNFRYMLHHFILLPKVHCDRFTLYTGYDHYREGIGIVFVTQVSS